MPGGMVVQQVPPGRWWVTWIDHAFHTLDQVHVALAPLDDTPVEVDGLVRLVPRIEIIRIGRASLPLFAVGDTFIDRKLVTDGDVAVSVCDRFAFGLTSTFSFDSDRFAKDRPEALGDTVASVTDSARRRRVSGLYPLTTTRNSRVLVVDASDGHRYLIPAAEILRSLVAPKPKLITALFGQLLTSWLEEAVKLPESQLQTGPFAFELLPGLGGDDAFYVANLVAAYNPHGAAALQRLFPSLRATDPDLKAGFTFGRLAGVADWVSPLPVCFPFGSGQMVIRAKCLDLGHRLRLVAKILGGRWPPSRDIDLTFTESEVDRGLAPVPRSLPKKRDGAVAPTTGPHGEGMDLTEAPSTHGEARFVAVERTEWTGSPSIVLTAKKKYRAPTYAVPAPPKFIDGVGFGSPSPQGNLHQGLADHSGRLVPDRFRVTRDVLDRLAADGSIDRHEDLLSLAYGEEPAKALVRHQVGDIEVWAFRSVEGRKWRMIEAEDGSRRARTLYVRRIVTPAKRILYWISVEGVGSTTYSALLVNFAEMRFSGTPDAERHGGALSRFLAEVVKKRARLPDPEAVARGVSSGHGNAVSFPHRLSEGSLPERSVGVHDRSEEEGAREISAVRALEALQGLI